MPLAAFHMQVGNGDEQRTEVLFAFGTASTNALYSFAFVLVCFLHHFRSIALALFGILLITLSLPLALSLYSLFVPILTTMCTLTLFVMIGIGADNLFGELVGL